jgi:hypothetical protein
MVYEHYMQMGITSVPVRATMHQTDWGFVRQTALFYDWPWFSWIIEFFGFQGNYPLIKIVDGNGQRTAAWDTFIGAMETVADPVKCQQAENPAVYCNPNAKGVLSIECADMNQPGAVITHLVLSKDPAIAAEEAKLVAANCSVLVGSLGGSCEVEKVKASPKCTTFCQTNDVPASLSFWCPESCGSCKPLAMRSSS